MNTAVANSLQYWDLGPHDSQWLGKLSASSIQRVTTRGNPNILTNHSLAFFSSVRCPGDIILKTYELARALREMDITIIGGFHSPMEKECLALLLRGTAPVVVCPARGVGQMRIPSDWKGPLQDGRLLLLSFFSDDINRMTARCAQQRNQYVAVLAGCILVAYAEPSGKTTYLVEEAMEKGKPVFTLVSPANTHLIDLGAVPIGADNPESLLGACLTHVG